jgi:hypothetical protein
MKDIESKSPWNSGIYMHCDNAETRLSMLEKFASISQTLPHQTPQQKFIIAFK